MTDYSDNSSFADQAREFFNKKPVKYTLIALFSLIFIGLVFLIGFYLAITNGYYGPLPDKQELKNIKTSVASEVYSSDGVLLGRYYLENRTTIGFDQIGEHTVNALVATEDARFYKHGGVDIMSLFRVLVKTIIWGDDSSGGGSTISQQLAKNLYPRQNHGRLTMPVNKLREMITAGKLEDIYNKEEILNLYLNTVPFSDNTYGVQVASKRFFNKDADELKVEEAATLIGMLKATGIYNPRTNPDKAKIRRNTVLDQMRKAKLLTQTQTDSLMKTEIKLDYFIDNSNVGIATYLREHLRHELKEWAANKKKPDGTPYNIYTDGLKIHTTIDSRMQQYAEEAVNVHLKLLQSDFDKHWAGQKPWGDDSVINQAMQNSPRYKYLKSKNVSSAKIKQIFNTKIPMTIFTHEGEKEKKMSPMDSIKYYYALLNAGFLVKDPANGHIMAWVGGPDFKYFKYDHVKSKRQVGSTFKPIVYSAAMEDGFVPCDYTINQLKTYTDYDNWTPRNSDSKYGGFYSMRGGLMKSMNTVTVALLMEIGVEEVIDFAERMGIETPMPKYPPIALGAADLTLMEMVNVYGVFANRGKKVPVKMISRIEDSRGKVLENYDKKFVKQSQVFPEEKADMMVNLLESVVDSGTARRLRWRYKFDFDIAGKTGTTQNHADGWFIGFTPKLVGGVWVGGDDRRIRFRDIRYGQGANMALPIWAEFMKRVMADKNFKHYAKAEFTEVADDLREYIDCPSYRAYVADYIGKDKPSEFDETDVPLGPDDIVYEDDEKPVKGTKKVPVLTDTDGPKKNNSKVNTKPKKNSKVKTRPKKNTKKSNSKVNKDRAEKKGDKKKKRKKFWDKVLGRDKN